MGETARRVVFPRRDAVDIEKFEVPELRDNEVLIQTCATLISTGTELAYLQGITKPIQMGEHKYPIMPGYSAAGSVITTGKGVTDLKKGDRVCVGGRHATRLIADRREVVRIPDGVSFEESTFHTLGATAMNGVRIGRLVLGETAVIFGMGIVGQLALQISRVCGAQTLVAVDLSDRRLEMAKRVGATATSKPAEKDLEALVKELTRGEMAEVVIEATGNPKVFPLALKLAAPLGRIVALGSPRGNTPELDLYTELHCRGLQLLGAHAAMHPTAASAHNKWTRTRNRELFLDLVSKGQIKTAPMITHRLPFAEAVDAFSMLVADRTQAVGVILEYDGAL
jgi:2-desacetyl-2-hydroxyethyl bacteriochlorophyllide A dehydrogenase